MGFLKKIKHRQTMLVRNLRCIAIFPKYYKEAAVAVIIW